ncbi:MAG: hypothetical protein SFX18_18605 [Pirellulales bacterium]|nr:hypothetical protein [Pirellulales bacterium]
MAKSCKSILTFCIACTCLALTTALPAAEPPTPAYPPPPASEADLQKSARDLLGGADPTETKSGQPTTAPVSQLGFVRTSVFGIEDEGAKFVYVFDRSASMGSPKNRPIRAAQAELLKSLAPLGKVHQFYIIFYNQEPRFFQPGGERGKLIFANDQNKAAAEKFVTSIEPEGATNHYDALRLALQYRPDVIFLLTDGDATDDLAAADLDQLEKLNAGGAKIHVIQFTGERPTGPNLPELAKRHRGEFKSVKIADLPGE